MFRIWWYSIYCIFIFDMAFGLMDWLRNKYITFRIKNHKHPFLWWNKHCTITFINLMVDACLLLSTKQ